jgi:hypothetical protein
MEQTTTIAAVAAAVAAAVLRTEQISGFDCAIISETFNFKSTDADKRLAGVEYEEVKDGDTVKYKRKSVTLELAYPLLSNFGIAGEFDLQTGKYADPVQNYIFGTIAADIYKFVQTKVSEGFTLADISVQVLATLEPSKRGGRKAEIDQELLDAAVLDFAKWLKAQGRKDAVIAMQANAIKRRLAGVATWDSAKVAKMGENWSVWYSELAEADLEKFAPAYDFINKKFTAASEIDAEDF